MVVLLLLVLLLMMMVVLMMAAMPGEHDADTIVRTPHHSAKYSAHRW
jgi:hypothetical protein